MATTPLDPCSPVEERLQLAEGLFDIVERAMSHTRATGSAIVLRRDSEWVVRTSNGIAPDVGAAFVLTDGVVGNCARTGKPFTGTVEEAAVDPALKTYGVRSLVVAPVSVNGKTDGVLIVTHQVAEAFSRMHAAIMMTMSGEIAGLLKRYESATKEAPQLQAVPAPLPPRSAIASRATEAVTPAPLLKPSPVPVAQKFVETATKADAPPVVAKAEPPAPMKLMIDQPIAPKPLKPAAETLKSTLVEPARVASMSLFELEVSKVQAKPAEVLGLGEDPHKDGKAIKTVVATVRPVELATFAGKYQPAKQSRPIAPLVAVAVLAVAGAAFGAWRHNRVSAAPPAHESAAVATPSPAPAATPAPVAAAETMPAAVVKESAPKAEAVKVAADKTEKAEKKQDTPETPAVTAPVIRVAAAKATEQAPAVAAPALNMLGGNALPQLSAPKPVSASLAVKRTTAVPAVALKTVPPVYPEIARRNGTSGEVKLQLTVSNSGKVSAVNVLSGPPLLRHAATNAVMQWQYRPATLDGRPVDSTVEVTVRFEAR